MFSTRQRSGLSSASTVASLVRAELAVGGIFKLLAPRFQCLQCLRCCTLHPVKEIYRLLRGVEPGLRGSKLPLQLLHSVLLGLNHLFYAVKLMLPVVLSVRALLPRPLFCFERGRLRHQWKHLNEEGFNRMNALILRFFPCLLRP